MDIEKTLDNLLRRGWRVEIKTHAFNRASAALFEGRPNFGPPEYGLSEVDGVFWMCKAYLWYHPKGDKVNSQRSIYGRVFDTPSEALKWLVEKINDLENTGNWEKLREVDG